MEYFKHDITASDDDKICELLAEEGYEYLGYYWRFVEYLYSRGGSVSEKKLKSVSWSLHMDLDKLNHLIDGFGLFSRENGVISSKRITEEVENFEEVGKRMSEIGRKGGKASAEVKRTVKRTVSECLTDGKADAQQNKKIKKENKKINKRDALSGDLPLNEAGLPEIDFGLGKFIE